jgi:hypothetical protein
MKTIRLFAALAAFATMALLFAAPASAQATRTWISGVGDDANPCSRTAPCKTFAGAISKTAAAGEIDCLDPGGFGALTITKAITLDCQGPSNGGVLVSGTAGISVSVPAGTYVQLIGLDFNGIGGAGATASSSGTNGVQVTQGGNISIINCLIYGFQNPSGGGAAAGGTGVFLANTAAGAHVLIENSVIRDNTFGVVVTPTAAASITIDHSVVESNVTTNLVVSNSLGTAVLQASTIAGAPTAISNTGGAVISYGNNLIRNPGAPTQTLPLQ